MAFRIGVGQSEVIHHIWQHGPGFHTHTQAELNQSDFYLQDCVSMCPLSKMLSVTLRHGKMLN